VGAALTRLRRVPEEGGYEALALPLGLHQAAEDDGEDHLALLKVKEALR
jgi:hypothetical protein